MINTQNILKQKILKKSFFTPKANVFVGKTSSPRIIFKPPLKEEILHFFKCIIKEKNRKLIFIMHTLFQK